MHAKIDEIFSHLFKCTCLRLQKCKSEITRSRRCDTLKSPPVLKINATIQCTDDISDLGQVQDESVRDLNRNIYLYSCPHLYPPPCPLSPLCPPSPRPCPLVEGGWRPTCRGLHSNDDASSLFHFRLEIILLKQN